MLCKHFDFYNNSSNNGKAKFVNKTVKFFKTKRYYSYGPPYYIVLKGDSYLDAPQDLEVNWSLKGKEKYPFILH